MIKSYLGRAGAVLALALVATLGALATPAQATGTTFSTVAFEDNCDGTTVTVTAGTIGAEPKFYTLVSGGAVLAGYPELELDDNQSDFWTVPAADAINLAVFSSNETGGGIGGVQLEFLNPQTWNWGDDGQLPCATPADVTLTPAECDALAVLNIPTVEGVVYSHESGPLNPGTHTVTAEAAEGYVLTKPPGDDTDWKWEFVIQAEPGCPGEPGDDGEDGQDGAPGTPGPRGESGGQGGLIPAGNSDQLPVTGSGTTAIVLVGLVFLALGIAGMWFTRRRQPSFTA